MKYEPLLLYPPEGPGVRAAAEVQALVVDLARRGMAVMQRDADLRRLDLSNANLEWSDFRGSDLRGTLLHFTNLRRADLRYCNLASSQLQGADLTGADLTLARMEGAQYDRRTRWPRFFLPLLHRCVYVALPPDLVPADHSWCMGNEPAPAEAPSGTNSRRAVCAR